MLPIFVSSIVLCEACLEATNGSIHGSIPFKYEMRKQLIGWTVAPDSWLIVFQVPSWVAFMPSPLMVSRIQILI